MTFNFLVTNRGTGQLYIMTFWLAITVANEFFVKKWFELARPGASGLLTADDGRRVGSCAYDCGMPSSHASFAVGTWALFLLEAAYSVVTDAFVLRSWSLPTLEIARWSHFWSGISFVPDFQLSQQQFVAFLAVWSVLLLPVPIMRVALYDHTVAQVSVGAALGGLCAMMWFRMSLCLRERFKGNLGAPLLSGLLTHNLSPPRVSIPRRDDCNQLSTSDALSHCACAFIAVGRP